MPDTLPEQFTLEFDLELGAGHFATTVLTGNHTGPLSKAPRDYLYLYSTAGIFRQTKAISSAATKSYVGHLMPVRLPVDGEYAILYIGAERGGSRTGVSCSGSSRHHPSLTIPRRLAGGTSLVRTRAFAGPLAAGAPFSDIIHLDSPTSAASHPLVGTRSRASRTLRMASHAPLVTVFAQGDSTQLIMAKLVLKADEIPFVVEGEGVQDLFGIGRLTGGNNFITGPAQIRVRAEDAERAREVLEEMLTDAETDA